LGFLLRGIETAYRSLTATALICCFKINFGDRANPCCPYSHQSAAKLPSASVTSLRRLIPQNAGKYI
jgi:hypothetical protein